MFRAVSLPIRLSYSKRAYLLTAKVLNCSDATYLDADT